MDFEAHRRSITLHCYRMLGSLQDAEEVTQESLLRAWQRQGEVRSSGATRAWLYQIATNACLDALKARRRRALPHLVAPAATATRLGPPADERLWVEPAPDTVLDLQDDPGQRPDERVSQRESIGLAFITALQFLTPKQRAALLLVDVLGWTPEDTATLLETTVFSVNSLLQRARKSVQARDREGPPPEPSSAEATLLRRFITTWESRDLDAFTALLADDVRLSMPPQPEWYEGREAVRGFLAGVLTIVPRQYRLLPVAANGGPAVAIYARPMGATEPYQASAIIVLEARAGRVWRMTRFTFPRLFPLFGLPSQLPPPGDVAVGLPEADRERR
jgi:RNA polymerase sigma-70 factor, ECF subfamily